jgi:hypothetical protein
MSRKRLWTERVAIQAKPTVAGDVVRRETGLGGRARTPFSRIVTIPTFGPRGRVMHGEFAGTNPLAATPSGQSQQQTAEGQGDENPGELPTRVAQRRPRLTGWDRVRAGAIRQRPHRAFATLRLAPRAVPTIATLCRKTFSGMPASAPVVRTKWTGMSFVRSSANPILVWTRVAIFLETELIKQAPHGSKFSRVDEGERAVDEREEDETVGKRNVHKKPEFQQALRGILEVNILRGLNPIAHLGGDQFFGVIQVAIERR